MSVLSESIVSLSNSRKRTGEDENSSVAPLPKKRLLGRTLGSQLSEVDSNAVSNLTPLETPSVSLKNFPANNESSFTIQTPHIEQDDSVVAPQLGSSDYEYTLSTSGKRVYLANKRDVERLSYERLIAQRSKDADAGKPQKEYYGVNIHELMAEAERANSAPRPEATAVQQQQAVPSIEGGKGKRRAGLMWTEKYRAKKYADLCGDERTHRQVLKWLKAWDPVVFPGAVKTKPRSANGSGEQEFHRKILMLTGPPGLGKTTLAHVCAKQAGYECVEVNASDERSSSVVKNRIRDCLGTENVRGVNVKAEGGVSSSRQPGKPVCVILDEVDGVAGNNSSGDGGFMKALVDLVMLDQKNSRGAAGPAENSRKRGKKGDTFRLLRPLILVCNDVYASSLRPLRAAGIAEIVHVRKPPLEKVIERVQLIFDKEGVACDKDAVRRLCEHTWGISGRREAKVGRSSSDGDMRSVMVTAEWAAAKLRAISAPHVDVNSTSTARLTKQWVEKHVIQGSSDSGSKGLGRGGAREVAERVFMENAGFAKKGRAELTTPQFKVPGSRQAATDASRFESIRMLRECIDTTDEHDRVMTEVFGTYPTHTFQDDMILTKPNAAYDWLDFHDRISSKLYGGQEWELKPYQSTSTLGFHYLFGNSVRHSVKIDEARKTEQQEAEEIIPFSGPRAAYDAYEFERETRATLTALQSSEEFNINLKRMFQSPEDLAVDLLPHLIRMLTPDVKPVVIGGKGERMASVRRESEREMIRRSVQAMGATGVIFEKCRVEDPRAGNGGFVYRMEPALDVFASYESLSGDSVTSLARFAVRQVMEQEHRKFVIQEQANARQARWQSGAIDSGDAPADHSNGTDETAPLPVKVNEPKVKRDFFGRVIKEALETSKRENRPASRQALTGRVKVWATFNEGYSNAVRKPITLKELLQEL